MKSLCIILPEETLGTVGGFKVAYIYANALVNRGFRVSIAYVSFFNRKYPKRYPFIVNVKKLTKFCIRRFLGMLHQNWFQLSPAIRIHTLLYLSKRTLPKADFYLATSIGSALTLDSIPKIMPQRKYYLIQHYEDWGGIPSDLVDETYRFPMNKICIAPWLVEKVNQVGKSACLIPNGFDQSEFPLKNPIETRSNNTIAFLGAELPWKGVVDTIEALRIVRAKYPKLVVQVFGTGERLDWYPEWVSYKRLPTHEELVSLYNNTAIFIGASHYEGFGLTIGEAMCCGCAIACTENGGFTVMVHHQETGLLSPIQDPAALAENIIFYIENPQERIRLAKQGNSYIRKFTWDDSVDRFVDFLEHPFEIQDEA